jgi:alkylated DNA nucleotide flippase Atl1
MAKTRSRRKSWREKLEHPAVEGLPKVIDVPAKWRKMMGGSRILVPTPLMADEAIRAVPQGRLVTTGQLRQQLAGPYKADSTCPMTLGIFLRIVSEAAEEDRREGRTPITPYWRVVKDDGSLNPKFPGGVEAHAARLQEEGHAIVPGESKKPPRVHDFQRAMIDA